MSDLSRHTFSFFIFWWLFPNNKLSNNTKKTLATSTATALSRYQGNPMIANLWWVFPPFFCFVHYSLTFSFIVVFFLLFLLWIFLYYYISVVCIYTTLHNITTQQHQQRIGYVHIVFKLNCIIILSNIPLISNCSLIWLFKHSFWFFLKVSSFKN